MRSAATFLLWLHRAFLCLGRDLAGQYGTWAVVTSATDGIGRTVTLELARQGLHLVLVGRSPDKLARVAKEVLAAAPSPSCKVRSVGSAAPSLRDGFCLLRRCWRELSLWMRDFFLCVTQNREWVSYLGLHGWRQSK